MHTGTQHRYLLIPKTDNVESFLTQTVNGCDCCEYIGTLWENGATWIGPDGKIYGEYFEKFVFVV